MGLLAALWGQALFGQDLSQEVYSSEDELWEALREGVITYEQYEVLRDLIEQGIDSASQHLLNEIPNLMLLMQSDSALIDPLQAEQAAAFRSDSVRTLGANRIGGRLHYRYQTQLDESERTWYRGRATFDLDRKWRADFRLARERSGRERVAGRTLAFRSRSGTVRRTEVGSFTARLGLGLLYGHRGRILDGTTGLDGESWQHPNYSGFNGASVETRLGDISSQAFFSSLRDATHRLTLGAARMQRVSGRTRPGVVIGYTTLVNRETDRSLDLPAASVILEHEYASGQVAAELGSQFGQHDGGGGMTAEGRHRLEAAELRYALWHYADDFIDLTSGSRSGALYLTDSIPSLAFDYRTRRTGQEGAVVRTAVPLMRRLTLITSLLHAGNVRGNRRRELSGELRLAVTGDYSARLSYLGNWQRETTNDTAERSSRQFRLEGRYDGDRIRAKCYIGFQSDGYGEGRASLFLSGRYVMADGTTFEVWSNLSKIGPDGVETWYGYGRGVWTLTDRWHCGVKVIHTYTRYSDLEHATQMSLELTAAL